MKEFEYTITLDGEYYVVTSEDRSIRTFSRSKKKALAYYFREIADRLESPTRKLRVIYFSTPDCVPCKYTWPVVQRVVYGLKKFNDGEMVLTYMDLGTDEGRKFKHNHQITSVPTIEVLDEAGNIVYRRVGAVPASVLQSDLEKLQ